MTLTAAGLQQNPAYRSSAATAGTDTAGTDTVPEDPTYAGYAASNSDSNPHYSGYAAANSDSSNVDYSGYSIPCSACNTDSKPVNSGYAVANTSIDSSPSYSGYAAPDSDSDPDYHAPAPSLVRKASVYDGFAEVSTHV